MDLQMSCVRRYVFSVMVLMLFCLSSATSGVFFRGDAKDSNCTTCCSIYERIKRRSVSKSIERPSAEIPRSGEGQRVLKALIRRKLNFEEDEEEEAKQQELEPSEESPLLTFRIIGCSVVTIFVGVTIIIYVTSAMFYLDCLMQICSEVCLLAAYTAILLITAEKDRIDKGFCLGVAIFLHFIFLTCFLFMLLEVVCMARYLLQFFPKKFLSTSRSVFLLGFGVPLAVSGISAIILYDEYTTRINCWLKLTGNALWPTVVPIGIFVGLQIVLLLMIIAVSEVPYLLSSEEYERAKCFLATRWSSLIITAFAVLSWVCGLMASYSNEDAYYAAFTVSSIFLGVVIFILRISTDDQIRKVMTLHVLSYFVKPTNKISAWSEKILVANKALPMEKKITMEPPRMNGDSNHVTIHR